MKIRSAARFAILLLLLLPAATPLAAREKAAKPVAPEDRDRAIGRALDWLDRELPRLPDVSGTPMKPFTESVAGLCHLMAGARTATGKDPLHAVRADLDRYLESVERRVQDPEQLPARHGLVDSRCLVQYTWPIAQAGVFFAELHRRGRDRGWAKSRMRRVVRLLVDAQAANGGWGHGKIRDDGGGRDRAPDLPEELGRALAGAGGYPETLLASSNVVAASLGIIEAALGKGTVKGLDRARAYYRAARLPNGNFPYDPSQRSSGASEVGVSRTGGALMAMHFLGISDDDREVRGSLEFLTSRLEYASEGHGSSMLNLAHCALALRALDEKAFARFKAMYFPRILAAQAEDGSFSCICEKKAFGTTCDSGGGTGIAVFDRGRKAYVTALLTFVLLLDDGELEVLRAPPIPAPRRAVTPR